MELDFAKSDGLLPVVVQDAKTSVVLMLGFMNEAALEKTKEEGKVTFFSRSKQRLWTKGETSGNFLFVKEILVDCDRDTLLIKALPVGPVCHTGNDTCFNEDNQQAAVSNISFLSQLVQVIHHRKLNPQEGSYTNHLFSKGLNKIAQKVGEEAVELVIEAKDDNKDLFLGEAADLLYHLLVLLEAKEISLQEVIAVLQSRHQTQK